MIAQSLVRPAARFTQVSKFNNVCCFPRSSAAARLAPRFSSCSCAARQEQWQSFPDRLNFSSFFSVFGKKSPATAQKNHIWCKRSAENPSGELERLVPEECELSVVLLGWLGAEQRHLRKYAEWYNSRGIHAITFVMPMNDLLSLGALDNVEGCVDSLYLEIAHWLCQSQNGNAKQRSIIFHTFSNTGWFFYGAILEKMQQEQAREDVLKRIKGCVVDSAPAAELSPQVWASGFSTAFLKKQSVSTQWLAGISGVVPVQPGISETLLLASLRTFFAMLLAVPAVKQRLLGIINILSSNQPPCPQLYLYSSADRVIPSTYVESFIALQKKAGYKVSSYNLKLSPHVDHLRNFPDLYCGQLQKFIINCFDARSGKTTLGREVVVTSD